MAHRLPDSDTPTQCRHPQRTVARSSLASTIGVLPILWPILDREVGPVWATVAVVAAIAGNALVTRLLAIPAVEAWLQAEFPALSAAGRGRDDRVNLSAPAFCSADPDAVQYEEAGGTAHAEAATRTVSGLVLPWDKPGKTTAGTLIVNKLAARLPADITRCKLFFKHTGQDGHATVGHATAYDVRDDGLYMSFKVARTPEGDAALAQVTEGVYDAFSVELHNMLRDGPHVTDSRIHGVALVDYPAFNDARVEEVYASLTPTQEKETPMSVTEFIESLTRLGLSDDKAKAIAAEQYPQEVGTTPPAGTPTPAESEGEGEKADAGLTLPRGPIVPAGLGHPSGPTVAHASAHEAAQTLAKMVTGRGGDIAHAALTDITNSGLIDAQSPQWLGELWSGPAKTRKLIPLLNRRDLRSWTVKGFKWDQKPLVAAYPGDKAEIPTGPVSVQPYEAEAVRWAGGHDLDRKFYDFGDADILEAYWRAMHESYAVVTDAAAGAFVLANATAVTDPAATDLLRAMISAAAAVDDAAGVSPSYFMANPADKFGLLDVNAQNLPVYLDLFGASPQSIKWTKAVPAGTLVAGARPAITFWELPGSPLRVEAEHLSHGGRDRAMFGYTALTVDNADAVVKVEFGAP